MAELTISSDEIRSAIENYTASYSPEASARRSRGVRHQRRHRSHHRPAVGDGQRAAEFPGGVLGVALNLDATEIGAVVG